tara:strand:+ start:176 stop:655 length:480 start_codon:yes stop_codon:yes gene_type:complete
MPRKKQKLKPKIRSKKKNKRKTRKTVKRINTSKLRVKDYFAILAGAVTSGFFFWIAFFIVSDQASWITFIISCVIAIPIAYWFQKKSSKCPSCNKDFQMSDTHTETINEYQKIETRERYKNGIRYKEQVPVDVRIYWQYSECDSCGFVTRREEKSKKNA